MKVNNSGIGSELQRLFDTCRWALRITWSTSSALMLGLCGIVLLRAIVPASLALAARGLINAAMAAGRGQGSVQSVLNWLLLGFLCALAESMTPLANQFLQRRLSDDINLNVTSDVLRHAAALDVASLEDPRFQDAIERAQQDTAGAFSTLIKDLETICADGLQVVVAAIILMYLEPLVIVVMLPFAAPYLFYRWRTAKARYAEEELWVTRRRWTRYFVSHLTGQTSAAETKLLGLGPLFLTRFRDYMLQVRNRDRRRYRKDFAGSAAFTCLTTIGFYVLFARVALQVVRGVLTVGDIALYAGVATRLRLTLERLIAAISSVTEQALHLDNLKTFLQEAPRLEVEGGHAPAARGEVELFNVSFTYPGSSAPAVSDVSLRIEPGEVVALVGENGAGKTTLIRLIARLYDADEGSVRIDGVDVRDWSIHHLHRSIAFLSQGFGRYEATAADNIAYGDWERILDDRKRVREAARAADAHDMIEAMPRGYETRLGRLFGEHDISGGQWQKLAVARTLARDAPLLILDEPTAYLDARAEVDLFRHFRQLARGRTTILVSHRLSALAMADRIIVLERGRIIECGMHDELLARSGTYAKLYGMYRMPGAKEDKGAASRA